MFSCQRLLTKTNLFVTLILNLSRILFSIKFKLKRTLSINESIKKFCIYFNILYRKDQFLPVFFSENTGFYHWFYHWHGFYQKNVKNFANCGNISINFKYTNEIFEEYAT